MVRLPAYGRVAHASATVIPASQSDDHRSGTHRTATVRPRLAVSRPPPRDSSFSRKSGVEGLDLTGGMRWPVGAHIGLAGGMV
jgi:hypothetical protein